MWNLWNVECGIQYTYCDYFLEHTNLKDDLIAYRCLCCSKNYQHKFHETLKEKCSNTYKFSNRNNNNFILLLQKGIYPYENMNGWKKFNEISLPEKEDCYSHLHVVDITDADYECL